MYRIDLLNPKKLSHIYKKTLCSWFTAHRRPHNLEDTVLNETIEGVLGSIHVISVDLGC